MQSTNDLQNWITNLDRRVYGALVGLTIGIMGGLIGLMLALLGPLLTLGALVGLLAGLYVLTNVNAALYGMIMVLICLPFGTLPIKIAITPTFLDLAMVAFLMVYLFQWMSGQRHDIKLTPVHILITGYIMWLILAFVLGMQYGMPTSTHIRRFAQTLLSISMTFVLVDLLRDPKMLRRLVLVVIVAIGIQAVLALGLYILNDSTAESLLVRLSQFGYPNGGVIRYVEDNPGLGERAIGTWVDPNALGGLLAIATVMIAPQVLDRKPILRYRWLTVLVFGAAFLALMLTRSRASFLAVVAGLTLILFVRYRRFIPLLIIAGILFLFLPVTQEYIDRLVQAFQGADLATQMRVGEWRDSLALISRYPVFGIGFTGTPERNLYTDVANMYLIMANQIGLVGVFIFLTTMLGVFRYGYKAWQYAKDNLDFASIHLGYHGALLTALVNAVADLYFFRLDFQSSITWFWLVVAAALATSRLAITRLEPPEDDKSTVAKPRAIV